MDIKKDFDPITRRDLEEITGLCIDFELMPAQQKEAKLDTLMEENIKKVLFEHEYLNEKIVKRNHKIQQTLNPML